MDVRSQGAASSNAAAAANRCGACYDSPRRSCRDRMAISLRRSRKEDDEGEQNSYHSALRTDLPRYDDDNADGDIRSTSRKDARKHQSPDLYARCRCPLREVAASKEARRRSKIKQTALRQSKDDDERGKTAKNKTRITCDSLLLRPDVRRSSGSGERWWQDGASEGANLKTRPADVS